MVINYMGHIIWRNRLHIFAIILNFLIEVFILIRLKVIGPRRDHSQAWGLWLFLLRNKLINNSIVNNCIRVGAARKKVVSWLRSVTQKRNQCWFLVIVGLGYVIQLHNSVLDNVNLRKGCATGYADPCTW